MKQYFESIPFHLFKSVKIDIGLSYSAPHSQVWLENDPSILVIGFEPNPESVTSILSKNIQRKSGHGKPIEDRFIGKNFFIIPVALSDVKNPSSMKFYKMVNDPGTSSLFEPSDKRLGNIKEIIDVPVYSLKHFY
jgi:hypothetical protein